SGGVRHIMPAPTRDEEVIALPGPLSRLTVCRGTITHGGHGAVTGRSQPLTAHTPRAVTGCRAGGATSAPGAGASCASRDRTVELLLAKTVAGLWCMRAIARPSRYL